jgi:hypothetical protein
VPLIICFFGSTRIHALTVSVSFRFNRRITLRSREIASWIAQGRPHFCRASFEPPNIVAQYLPIWLHGSFNIKIQPAILGRLQ